MTRAKLASVLNGPKARAVRQTLIAVLNGMDAPDDDGFYLINELFCVLCTIGAVISWIKVYLGDDS